MLRVCYAGQSSIDNARFRHLSVCKRAFLVAANERGAESESEGEGVSNAHLTTLVIKKFAPLSPVH